ncbi:hypothetical protein OC834_008013, partial [Tilletia horrida]
ESLATAKINTTVNEIMLCPPTDAEAKGQITSAGTANKTVRFAERLCKIKTFIKGEPMSAMVPARRVPVHVMLAQLEASDEGIRQSQSEMEGKSVGSEAHSTVAVTVDHTARARSPMPVLEAQGNQQTAPESLTALIDAPPSTVTIRARRVRPAQVKTVVPTNKSSKTTTIPNTVASTSAATKPMPTPAAPKAPANGPSPSPLSSSSSRPSGRSKPAAKILSSSSAPAQARVTASKPTSTQQAPVLTRRRGQACSRRAATLRTSSALSTTASMPI